MNDNEIDDIVNKTIDLIEKDHNDNFVTYLRFNSVEDIDMYFLNKKDYMKLLIKGEITNTRRKIHDLIEEYQLKENKKLMRRLIELDGNALKYAGKELRNDKEFVLEAVRKNGFALYWGSEELRNDKEFMLEAVKQNGYALKYASEELQNDKEVVYQAQKTIIMNEIEIGRNKR